MPRLCLCALFALVVASVAGRAQAPAPAARQGGPGGGGQFAGQTPISAHHHHRRLLPRLHRSEQSPDGYTQCCHADQLDGGSRHGRAAGRASSPVRKQQLGARLRDCHSQRVLGEWGLAGSGGAEHHESRSAKDVLPLRAPLVSRDDERCMARADRHHEPAAHAVAQHHAEVGRQRSDHGWPPAVRDADRRAVRASKRCGQERRRSRRRSMLSTMASRARMRSIPSSGRMIRRTRARVRHFSGTCERNLDHEPVQGACDARISLGAEEGADRHATGSACTPRCGWARHVARPLHRKPR